MDSKEKTRALGFVIIGIIITSIFFGVMLYNNKEEICMNTESQEQPMLLVEFSGAYENIDDPSEIFFDYFIYNFGNTEAKNVSIICRVQDDNDVSIKDYKINIGNIASNSYEFQESIFDYNGPSILENYGTCYLESANGKYINLYERLDDIE